MCRKTVYYNTYGDGAQDVTERVDTCRPGRMCSQPEIHEYARSFGFNKRSSAVPETPAYRPEFHQPNLFPPTPGHSKSPSPSRRRESGVYVNGSRVTNVSRRRNSTTILDGPESRYARGHVVVVPQAPEAPAPASARPASRGAGATPDYVVVEGSRNPRRSSSRSIPVGPVAIAQDLSRPPPPRRSSSLYHHHRPHRSASPPEIVIHTDDEHEGHRQQRRRHRHSRYHGADGSDHTQNSSSSQPLPARKELRWEDQVAAERAAQNERIARRPKLHQAEVKGILKNNAGQTAGDDNDKSYADLQRAVENLEIRGRSARRAEEEKRERERERGRREASARDREEEMYWDRLRGRFEDTKDRRRQSRIVYPGEGLYKYR